MSDAGSSNKITLLRSAQADTSEDAVTNPESRPPEAESEKARENSPPAAASESARQRRAALRLARRAASDPTSPDARAKLLPERSPLAISAPSLPPLPQRSRKRSYATAISFLVCVLLPTLLLAAYYLGIASNQYVTSFHFAVRDAKSAAVGMAPGGMPSLFGSAMSPNSEENYIVTDYLTSRQAVEDLERRIGLIGRYTRPDVDWIARFKPEQPIERFVAYWKRMTTASYDQVTGISIAEVRAFTPEDAFAITNELTKLAEELINEVANRPQLDAIRFAENDLKRAEDRLKAARAEVTKFRNSERLIDPQASVVTTNVLLAQTLRQNLTQLQTELSTDDKRKLSPDSPVIRNLETRIRATRDQLAEVEAHVAYAKDGNTPLSKVVGEFEQLELERQFAQGMVTAAMQTLEQARSRALAQHVYVTPYVKPIVPQSSTYPRRYLSIAIGAFCLFLFWLVCLLIARSIRERLV